MHEVIVAAAREMPRLLEAKTIPTLHQQYAQKKDTAAIDLRLALVDISRNIDPFINPVDNLSLNWGLTITMEINQKQ